MRTEKVSIIVPSYNAQDTIRALLQSLLALDYPKELIEVIVVDNNSKDSTRSIVYEYLVVLLEETEIQSSYAARNRGIQNAGGEILAFIDADCTVDREWLSRALSCLNSSIADLIAGNVIFTRTGRFNILEIYDSSMYLQQKYNVSVGAATTANLVVRKRVFDEIGLFPIVQTGGDVRWTKKATSEGFSLIYCQDAKVFHPARGSFSEAVEKEIRFTKASGILVSLLNMHVKSIYDRLYYINGMSAKSLGLFMLLFFLKKVLTTIAAFVLIKRSLERRLRGSRCE